MKLCSTVLACLLISGMMLSRVTAGTHAQEIDEKMASEMETQVADQTEDDFSESTDVTRTETANTRSWTEGDSEYQLTKDEEVIQKEYKNGKPMTSESVTVLPEIQPDGSVVTKVIKKSITVTPSTTITTVKKKWVKNSKIPGVAAFVTAFGSAYGKELTDKQLKLFNTMAATDPTNFYSSYDYMQVKMEHLSSALKSATSDFYMPPSQNDLQTIEYSIRKCKSGQPVVSLINTSPAELYTKSLWRVRTEVIFATCGSDQPAVQIFTWSASKEGTWTDPSYFSAPNSKTVDDTITQWLFRQMFLLFDCSKEPVPVQPNSQSRRQFREYLTIDIKDVTRQIFRDDQGNIIEERVISQSSANTTGKWDLNSLDKK